MTELVDDDLILESVTHFKFPSASNDEGIDMPKFKMEPEICENQESLDSYNRQQNDYTPNESYHMQQYQSPYFSNQNQCNYGEHNTYQYNNYPAVKQEIKSEPYEYCNKEQDCYSSQLPYMSTLYGYQHQQQQHPKQQQPQRVQQQYQQNGPFWNDWNQQYAEQSCCSPQSSCSPASFPDMKSPQAYSDNSGSKKRGRKKKFKSDGDESMSPLCGGSYPTMDMMSSSSSSLPETEVSCDSKTVVKERRKHDRFNGMPEEEVSKRTLPDLLASNLDIVIIGINPGLFAAYKGHHYAGPGNHFWKCLYMSGLINEQLSADDDYKLLQWGIGFTNMVERATKGSSDLTRKEIREGGQILLEKLQKFKPKIAVFNGKLIFEVFSGKKEFNFGRQPDFVDGTNTYMWVMPSSSARCAQLPRASDKVPYYAALKKFRDYLNGAVSVLDENDLVFQYCKLKTFPRHPKEEIKVEPLEYEEEDFEEKRRKYGGPIKNEPTTTTLDATAPSQSPLILGCGSGVNEIPMTVMGPAVVVVKKKRGRPKKIRTEDSPKRTPNGNTADFVDANVNLQSSNGTTIAPRSIFMDNINGSSSTPTPTPTPTTPLSLPSTPLSLPSTPVHTSKYFPETLSPGYCHGGGGAINGVSGNNFSPSYHQQFLSPVDGGYYSQNSLESAFNTYDFHPSEIQSHLRSFLPSSCKPESTCSLNE